MVNKLLSRETPLVVKSESTRQYHKLCSVITNPKRFSDIRKEMWYPIHWLEKCRISNIQTYCSASFDIRKDFSFWNPQQLIFRISNKLFGYVVTPHLISILKAHLVILTCHFYGIVQKNSQSILRLLLWVMNVLLYCTVA